MKFTLSQLKQSLDTNASAQEIAEKLTALGLEVEEVVDKGALYAPFTIAEIRNADKHPNADRLKLCTVWTGSEELQIVCGAPNARTGIKVVLARPGDYIPGLDVTLKLSKIRDVESQGMMCSQRELLLSDEHEGIIELPDDAPVGAKFLDYAGLNETLIDVAITPNRGDCASVYGIARDLAAGGLGTLKALDASPVKSGYDSPVSVKVETPICPHFAGRYIKNVKNGPSPEWLQKWLRDVGMRPISALVDLTNYFTHNFGRPLHVYDADKIGKTIVARNAKQGEELVALNDKTYTLTPDMCAITDKNVALGIGGVMGGLSSGCTDDTVNVFLESAWFEPNTIARTGRALEIVSDARYRFERGVDPEFTAPAIELATKMIVEMCGGEASHVVIAGAPVPARHDVKFDAKKADAIIGVSTPVEEQKDILQRLGCSIKGDVVTTPSWRPDLVTVIDLVEEIARVKGFDKIKPAYLPALDAEQPYKPHSVFSKTQKLAIRAKKALAANGFQETITYSFLSDKDAALWGDIKDGLRLTNPISADLSVMRPSLLPNLLGAAGRNAARGFKSGALFELGPVFNGTEADEQPMMLAGIRFGDLGARHWRGASASRRVDALDVKQAALSLLEEIGLPTNNLKTAAIDGLNGIYHPGQSAQLSMGKEMVVRFGVLHPALLDALDVKTSVAAFEINWPYVLQFMERKKDATARPLLHLHDLQAVTRDFAFLVDKSVQASQLVGAIEAADKALISAVRVFDLYEGKGVPEGQVSVAIEVTLQPTDKTLDEEMLQKTTAAIVAAAEKATGAKIRG